MVSTDNGEVSGGVDETSGAKVKGVVPLHIGTSRRELLGNEDPQILSDGSLSSVVNRMNFFNFGALESPTIKFQRIAVLRDEFSRSVPFSGSIRERISKVFSRKIDWNNLKKICKEWIRNPMNMVLLLWVICVAVSGAILFLVMTGMLNSALPSKNQRNAWFEVNNQILNALFTLMCLYQHPQRLYHLVLLLRWKPEDISRLRKVYCKNGTYKPHEWVHMMVVILLLNLNCFAQYALCGLNVGYKRSDRPALGVGITISFAIGCPAIAGVYAIVSPLGKDYHSELDEEAQQLQNISSDTSRKSPLRLKTLEKRFSFAHRSVGKTEEDRPQWSGGIFDMWEDISLAYLSLFCSFCVFGWNMERLGFGNMYVHIATFLLFCLAPFWIFNLAAVNINDEVVREILGLTGVFLCIFGLLYGGFWRIQMRKRFNLPPYTFCWGKPAVADCAMWLFCCWCTLAQEVRTGNAYNIEEDKFYKKKGDENTQLPTSPLPREDEQGYQVKSGSSSPFGNSSSPANILKANSSSPSRFSNEYRSPGRQLPAVEELSDTNNKHEIMKPPTPALIQRETS
ncbi:Protein PLANT CADMIUM RESISTANCE like [Heracleum sosnowskyi]|uniref:Protein PLANT CADMIUM RESISTANCE like n=1 Tax=Heracleum sosnowskyi TaxID=360622 RepID=A0AAD8I5J1_9APIA|nr:Protein PLANT CADMIUM RESISTANCE like [Heracleum sosnowskyi]